MEHETTPLSSPPSDDRRDSGALWLAVLADLGGYANGDRDVPHLLASVAQSLASHIGDGAVILLTNDDQMDVAAVARRDGSSSLQSAVEPLRLRVSDPWVRHVLTSRQPLQLRDFSDPPMNGHTPAALQQYLSSPGMADVLATSLVASGRTIGILSLVRDQPGAEYRPEDSRYIAVVASQISLLIERSREAESRRALERERDVTTAVLETVLETAPIGFAAHDPDLRFLKINERLAEVNGLPVDEHLGRTIEEVLPELAPSLLPRLRHVLDTGEPLIDLELSDAPSDGSGTNRHWRTSHYPIRLSDGELIGVGAIVSDVTEQRQVDLELRARLHQQEAVAALGQLALRSGGDENGLFDEAARIVAETLRVRYVAVLETLPDGEATLLRNGVGWPDGMVGEAVIAVNRKTQSGTAILTRAPLIVEDLPAETQFRGSARLLSFGIVSSINVLIAGRGRPWGVLSAHSTRQRRFTPDDIHFMQAVANVLSSAIERRLVEHERQMLLDSANEGMFGMNLDGICTYINQAALDLLGYTAEECLGRNLHELAHYKRPDGSPYPVGECPIYQSMWHGAAARLIDETLWRKDGSPLPALYSCSPVVEYGRVTGAVVTIVDVREQRRAEEALRESLERAERLARAEQEARQEAEAAIGVREEFLSIASHELKTPLTTIKATAQLLDRRLRLPEVDLDRILRHAALLQREISRLETLVDDLLNATHIQRGRLELRPEEVDLIEITRIAISRFEHAPERHQEHQIVLTAPARLTGWLDPGRIDQVLTNLISNALKYSPDGGEVRVTIRELDDGDVPEAEGTRAVEIAVRDAGIGITPEEQRQLFQPFARGADIRQRIRGSGLGLYITARIVTQHGGSIRVESAPGEGSTFIVSLPVGVTSER